MSEARPAVSRRTVIEASIGALAGAAVLHTVPASAADTPADFPRGVALYRRVFRSWDGAVSTEGLLTCAPSSTEDLLAVVGWAHANAVRVRASGYRHTWSPLTVAPGTPDTARVLLVDTTSHLTAMSMAGTTEVRVGAGASMQSLLAFLESRGCALTGAPAAGDVTVGGVLAIGGHGTAVPAAGERRGPGQSFGSVSNLVTSLTAVVWDEGAGRYVTRTFSRTDPDSAALLVHLGRAFVTEVTLRVVPAYNLRCRCLTTISAGELFAAPDRVTPRSLTSLLDASGRVGVIWYAFTDRPWVQVWDVAPRRPLLSRPTFTPYNFLFADNLPTPVPQLLGDLVAGQDWVAPAFGPAVLAATDVGLTASLARDMWGPSKNFIHFVKPTTLRVTAGSHVVVTSRAAVQQVVHDFTTFFTDRLKAYQGRGEFPINSGVEIRVTGIDDPADIGTAGAVRGALSPACPVPGRPEWDTAVWLDVLTLPGTDHASAFYADLEGWFRSFDPAAGVGRPEWSKRWAATPAGAWTDARSIDHDIPRSFDQWDTAVRTLDRLDPHRIFGTELLDRLLVPRAG